MFEATFSNENGEIMTVNLMAQSWQEAGEWAENEQDETWVLISINRLTW